MKDVETARLFWIILSSPGGSRVTTGPLEKGGQRKKTDAEMLLAFRTEEGAMSHGSGKRQENSPPAATRLQPCQHLD